VFLPIGDTPNPVGFKPYVTWGLLAANVAIFVFISLPLMSEPASLGSPGAQDYLRALGSRPGSLYDLFVFNNGFKPGAPQLSDLFSSMFLHGGFAHLAGNMLFLWIYGDNVEHYLGRVRYVLVYLGTGVLATVTFAAFAGSSLTPLVGASGAISGILGLYFLLFPRNRIKVFVLLFPFIMNVFLVPARIVLGVYLVLDNLFPALLGAQSGVAYGAHIGGFIGGLAVAWAVERLGGRRPLASQSPWRSADADPRPLRHAVRSRSSDPFEDLRDALEAQRKRDAVNLGLQLGPEGVQRLSVPETVQLARYLNDADQWAASSHLLRQALAENQTNGRALAEIYLALGLIRLDNDQSTAAYQHLLTAMELAPHTSVSERAKEALQRIDPSGLRPRR